MRVGEYERVLIYSILCNYYLTFSLNIPVWSSLIYLFNQTVLLSSKITDGCVEGFGLMSGSCQPCQPGFYNDAADNSPCQECTTGKDTVHMNSTACGKLIHVIRNTCMYSVICLLLEIAVIKMFDQIIYTAFSLILPNVLWGGGAMMESFFSDKNTFGSKRSFVQLIYIKIINDTYFC